MLAALKAAWRRVTGTERLARVIRADDRSSLLDRWRRRASTRRARRLWGGIFPAGFVLRGLLVRDWVNEQGHTDWTADGPRPLYILVTSVGFWPMGGGIWWLLYPADTRVLPWASKQTTEWPGWAALRVLCVHQQGASPTRGNHGRRPGATMVVRRVWPS
jgi:hypothetical protein